MPDIQDALKLGEHALRNGGGLLFEALPNLSDDARTEKGRASVHVNAKEIGKMLEQQGVLPCFELGSIKASAQAAQMGAAAVVERVEPNRSLTDIDQKQTKTKGAPNQLDTASLLSPENAVKVAMLLPDDTPLPVGSLAKMAGQVVDVPALKALENIDTVEKHGNHFQVKGKGLDLAVSKKEEIMGVPINADGVHLGRDVSFDLDPRGKVTSIEGVDVDVTYGKGALSAKDKSKVKELELTGDSNVQATVSGPGNMFDVKEKLSMQDVLPGGVLPRTSIDEGDYRKAATPPFVGESGSAKSMPSVDEAYRKAATPPFIEQSVPADAVSKQYQARETADVPQTHTDRTTVEQGDGQVFIKNARGERVEISDRKRGPYTVYTHPNGDQFYEFQDGLKVEVKGDSKGTVNVRSWNDGGEDGVAVRHFYADGKVENHWKDGSGSTIQAAPDGGRLIHSWSQTERNKNYDKYESADKMKVVTRFPSGNVTIEERDTAELQTGTHYSTDIFDTPYKFKYYPGHLTHKGADPKDNYEIWTTRDGQTIYGKDGHVSTGKAPTRKDGFWVMD